MTDSWISPPLITGFVGDAQRARIEASLRDYGTVLLGPSEAEVVLLDFLVEESRRFFASPPEAKAVYIPTSPSDWTGYLGPRSSGADDEADDFERLFFAPGTPESTHVATLARNWRRLYESANEVFELLIDKSRRLNRVLSAVLGVDSARSDPMWFDRHSSKMAINHYPHASADALAAHRDFGGISLIYDAGDTSGLQLSDPENDQWYSIDNGGSPALIALLGVLYSYWTDGVLPSVTHRVASPRPGRTSIVLFHTPHRQVRLSGATGANPPVLVESFLSRLEQGYRRIK